MNRQNVKKLLGLLGVGRLNDGSEWVRASCPFAPWTHGSGTDSRPSFGVSVGEQSHYHCFSCQRSGPLPMLVTALCMLRGEDNLEARQFVTEHESFGLKPYEDLEDPEPLTVLAPALMRKFVRANVNLPFVRQRGITEEAIEHFNLRYDPGEARLIFPIFDGKNQLVGFRGRTAGASQIKYREYSELNPKRQSVKGHGIWFGMQHHPPPDKKVILVEGELDAVRLSQALRMRSGVWAAMGASISDEQIKTIMGIKNPVVLFFDDDMAGTAATSKLMARLARVKPCVFRVRDYGGCKDPDEIVSKGRLKRALKSLVQVG